MPTIQLKRGDEADLPILAEGEPAFTLDTNKLFIGDGATNHEIGSGDVVGPSSAVSNGVALFDGTTGKLIKDGGVLGSAAFASTGAFDPAGTAAALNIFKTIAVSGQSNVVADSSTDTLTIVAGSNVTITTDASTDTITIAASGGGGGSGTVTSVAMTVPAGFSVAGSPITTSGTLAVTADSQAANLVYASPASGGGAAPDFRALVTDDLANGLVTKAKIEDASEACLLGRGLGSGAGDVQEITLGSGITMSGASLIADTAVLATLADVAALEWTEESKTASWTVAATTNVLYRVSTGSGNVTATLPAMSGNTGMIVAFELSGVSGTNTLTIDGNGTEQINSALTCVLTTLEDCVILICDGLSGWTIVADNRAKKWVVSAKYADFTAGVITNTAYHVDVSGASRTATLPAASGNAGLVLAFTLTVAPGGNTLTIDGNGSETINGATTLLLYALGDTVTLICDGSNWKILTDGRIPHRCLLTNNASQTISNATLTIVTFNTETFDDYAMHSTSSNTGRINILRTGQYWMFAFTIFASASAGVRQIYYKVNGSYTQATIFPISVGSETQVYFPALVNLTAGDYVEMVVWHGNGGNLNINNAANATGLIFGVTEVR